MSKIFALPCVWMEKGTMFVEADSFDKAKAKAIESESLPLGQYTKGSLRIIDEMPLAKGREFTEDDQAKIAKIVTIFTISGAFNLEDELFDSYQKAKDIYLDWLSGRCIVSDTEHSDISIYAKRVAEEAVAKKDNKNKDNSTPYTDTYPHVESDILSVAEFYMGLEGDDLIIVREKIEYLIDKVLNYDDFAYTQYIARLIKEVLRR